MIGEKTALKDDAMVPDGDHRQVLDHPDDIPHTYRSGSRLRSTTFFASIVFLWGKWIAALALVSTSWEKGPANRIRCAAVQSSGCERVG